MSFLNPFLLFGSLALAIPVLIHLVRREKSEIVPFSSLMFLLKVPKRSIRQQKIKNLLNRLLIFRRERVGVDLVFSFHEMHELFGFLTVQLVPHQIIIDDAQRRSDAETRHRLVV